MATHSPYPLAVQKNCHQVLPHTTHAHAHTHAHQGFRETHTPLPAINIHIPLLYKKIGRGREREGGSRGRKGGGRMSVGGERIVLYLSLSVLFTCTHMLSFSILCHPTCPPKVVFEFSHSSAYCAIPFPTGHASSYLRRWHQTHTKACI